MSIQEIERVNQLYRFYLDIVWEVDYTYKKYFFSISKKSKHFDFLIAAGAAASGGSGLAIIKVTDIAWLCGFLTISSTIGGLIKASYDWAGRINHLIELIKFYTPLKNELKNLTDDVIAKQIWDSDFENRYEKLRSKLSSEPRNMSVDLSKKIRREIQNEIKQKYNYRNWWNWRD